MIKQALKIYTIGHSTHPVGELIAMLQDVGITQLIDIRTIPKSRFNPQYNSEALAKSLGAEKIKYVHMAALGGLRHAHKDSINAGWRNASFRGYADYMQTEAFANAVEELIAEARRETVAIMCAEAVPWRCHRSLVSDALLHHGIDVEDIMGLHKVQVHKINPMARIKGGKVYYPKEV